MMKKLTLCATGATLALTLLGVVATFAPAMRAPSTPTIDSAAATPQAVPANPAALSDEDAARYRAIFLAQEKGDFRTADTLGDALGNRELMGYVLAQRYLSSQYKAKTDELDQWLAHYGDMPGASRIAALARRGLPVAVTRSSVKPLAGDGYIDHLGASGVPEGWRAALTLWRAENYEEALTLFRRIGDNERLSPWQRAAGYYWAYRAADRMEDVAAAREALADAAQYDTTFYGLLANARRGGIRLQARAPQVSYGLRHAPATTRAALLAQLGKAEEAEAELRLLYAKTAVEERSGIITLASEMNLPNLQVRLASTPGLSRAEKLFALYPRPGFMEAQAAADTELLMAIARNESAFKADAGSPMGARGLMQMLPSTALSIDRRMHIHAPGEFATIAERLADPATATRYGAAYVKILSNEPSIKGDLVRLLAGYNAGPGTVAGWSQNAEDPLLYIESIPYAETRNYVMQVLAQYWVYQALDGQEPSTLASLIGGGWPQV